MQTKMEPPSSSTKRGVEDKEGITPAKKHRNQEPSALHIENWRPLYLPLREKHTALRPWPESYDPNEPRVCKLKKIIRILKYMNTSIHLESSPPPPPSVLRIYNRIVKHANHCILLYHREAACANVLPDPYNSTSSSENIQDVDDDMVEICLNSIEECSLIDWKIDDFLSVLKDLIAKDVSNSPPTSSSSEEEVVEEYPGLCLRQQQLLDILYVLEKMAIQRKYAPPDSGEEILCYKKIRERAVSSLFYVHAQASLAIKFPTTYTANGKRWFSIDPQYFPRSSPCCHDLATTLELIPQCISLVKRCKNRLKGYFSPPEEQSGIEDDEGADERVNGVLNGLATEVLRIPEAEEKELEMCRIRTLQQILYKVDALGKIIITPDTLPTVEEVRIYAQIEDHVDTGLWLTRTRPEYKPCVSDIDLILQIHQVQTVDPDIAMDVQTREHHLREILSLLESLKLSSLGVMPTLVEGEYYKEIMSKLCCHNFKTSSCSLGTEFNDIKVRDRTNRSEVSDKTGAMLMNEMLKLYKKEQCFFNKLKVEIAEILNMVCGCGSSAPLWCNASEGTSGDACVSSGDGQDQFDYEPESLLGRSSLGSDQLKQATAVLQEAQSIISPLLQRTLHVNSVFATVGHGTVENSQKTAREINNAHHVITFQVEAEKYMTS